MLRSDTNIYSEFIEQDAIEQFYEITDHDEIVAGALMPDAHKGYTLPIGGVVASKGLIFPAFVGYDIGCGMCAVKTTYRVEDVREKSRMIWREIQRRIPVGFNHHKTSQEWKNYGDIPKTVVADDIFRSREGTGWKQLGTLGGGNHFIEIGADEEQNVWIIIHSGSRGIGHAIATHYMKIAGDGKAREGFLGLDVNSDAGQDYIMDLAFGLEFALENRLQMMYNIERSFNMFLDEGMALWDGLINRNHNHAELEELGDHGNVWIHRKGATHARLGMFGVIPGNMRDGSFIVRGLGNPDSLFSSSHGAGRVLGRKQAKRDLNVDDFRDTMEGILCVANKDSLDESPFAYKDIFQVMRDQGALVETVAHVKPIFNIKG